MKKTLLILFIITSVIKLYGQQDLVIGTSYNLNLQRKNSHGDAWILHNAEYYQGDDILKWKNSHASFGSRGIRFSYSTGKGIYFYADDKETTANFEFTPTTRFFIGNNGNLGIGTTTPNSKLQLVTGNANGISWKYSASYGESSISNIFDSGSDSGNKMNFNVNNVAGVANTIMTLRGDGNVGIGTANPQSELAVNGTITSTEVVVTTSGWSDFVFNRDYNLKDLAEVEKFIEENNHLPGIPSEKEVLENGIQVGEMNAKLLQKIEELTLYMIEQNKETKKLIEKADKYESEIEELKKEISSLKTQ